MTPMTLEDIHNDLEFLKHKVTAIEQDLKAILDEPELQDKFIEKMERLEKEKGIPFKNINELRALIENA